MRFCDFFYEIQAEPSPTALGTGTTPTTRENCFV